MIVRNFIIAHSQFFLNIVKYIRMNILLTGVAGFIGVNICKRLLDEGHCVTGIDNFYASDSKKIEHLLQYNQFSFIKNDIIESWDSIISSKDNFDIVCNFACPASPSVYLKDPVYTTKVSVLGTLHALEYVTQHNIPLLHASTSEVYGDPLEHPQREIYYGNVNPIGIRSCYDEGKRVAESLCFDFNRTYNTTIKIIRIFNTYGPFMERNDGRVISNFIDSAIQKKPLTIYGNGKQTRSFCFIDDLVEGIVKFLFLKDTQVTGPINLGNTEEICINDLVNIMQGYYPILKYIYKPMMENDPKIRKPDIGLANSILNWSPKISLREGLNKTIEWFSEFYV